LKLADKLLIVAIHTPPLLFCSHLSKDFDEVEWNDPITTSVFVSKIAATHYLDVVDYIKVMLPSLEIRITTLWIAETEVAMLLNTINQRYDDYCEGIRHNVLSLSHFHY
jgi:hypothetical protein